MVGQQHICFPRQANNAFHSTTGEKLTRLLVLIRVKVQKNGTDNRAAKGLKIYALVGPMTSLYSMPEIRTSTRLNIYINSHLLRPKY
jgi:hypothetical protein